MGWSDKVRIIIIIPCLIYFLFFFLCLDLLLHNKNTWLWFGQRGRGRKYLTRILSFTALSRRMAYFPGLVGSRVQLYLSYPQEKGFRKLENACIFFLCMMSFLDHKNSIGLNVCSYGKNRACSPSLNVSVSFVQIFLFIIYFFRFWLKSWALKLWRKHMFNYSIKHKGGSKVHFINSLDLLFWVNHRWDGRCTSSFFPLSVKRNILEQMIVLSSFMLHCFF